jgi:carbon monoxide dehydrogenase subunit G
MRLEHSFEVDAPVEQVWTALIDLEKVAPCLPGAAITGHDEDGTYHGEFKVKLGPTTAAYRGTIRIESADAETHAATLAARGTDKRGQGGASATIVNTLQATDAGGTRVDAVTDFTITGRLASFGRGGMMKDISNRLLRDFATCLQQRLASEPAGDLTAGEAAASAGAAATAEGKSPAEIREEPAPADVSGSSPAEPTPPGVVATPPQAAPPPAASQPAAPQPAAAPVKGLSLLLGVLKDRIKRLFGRT